VDERIPATRPAATVARASVVMAFGTLVSRLLGMVRALMLAWVLGLITLSSNAFATANTVPNSVFMLVASGVLNAALVPQIARAAAEPDGGRRQLDQLFTLAVAGLAAVTTITVLLAPFVPAVLARGFDSDTARLTVAFAYWCLPQVFFYGLYAVLGQVLNARGVFGPYTWAPVLNNIVAIAGLGTFVAIFGAHAGRQDPAAWSTGEIALLAGTSTAGVVAQALVLALPLRRAGVSFRLRLTGRGTLDARLGRVAGWTFGAAVVSQLGYVVTSNLSNAAAAQGFAGRMIYDNAYLIFMLPHSLIAVSIVTALFTRLSRSAATGDVASVRSDVSGGLRVLAIATIPAVAAILSLAPEGIALLYPGNAPAEREALALVVSVMALGLVPLGAQHLLQRAFYAFQDARTPFLVQLAVVGVSASVAVLGWLVLPPRWTVAGVALGLSSGLLCGALLSATSLRRRLGPAEGAQLGSLYLRLSITAAAAGAAARAAATGVSQLGDGYVVTATGLMTGGVVLLCLYIAGCRALGIPEMDATFRATRRRFGGHGPRGRRP
jgi:putative peptidoglycan lipid II flippase